MPVESSDRKQIVTVASPPRHTENLALIYQEIFTAIVRLRARRQSIPSAETFRGQVRHAVKLAEQNAKRGVYTEEDIRLATFAAVAFLDESILNLRDPIFDQWVRKPLQEELFGRHTAGEIFFDNVQRLLGRRDSAELADLLEVYYLCLLLGFGGRYSVSGKGELRALKEALADKIQRIRNSRPDLSPHWELPADRFQLGVGSPWTRRIMLGSGSALLLWLILFSGYKLSLRSGVGDVRAQAVQVR